MNTKRYIVVASILLLLLVVCVYAIIVCTKSTEVLESSPDQGNPSRPVDEQVVIWKGGTEYVSVNPGHYLNHGGRDDGDAIITACGLRIGKWTSGALLHYGTVKQMRADGRKPYPKCVRALTLFTR